MPSPLAPGQEELNNLQAGGFSSDEISKWKADTSQQLLDSGFAGKEVDDYFGVKNPDMTPTKDYVKANTEKNMPTPAEGAIAPISVEGGVPKPKEAANLLQAIEAGWDMSVTGLFKNGKLPDTVLPEHAPMFYRIASQVGTLAGDIPAMAAGSIGGGFIGGEAGAIGGSLIVPGIGTLGGAAIGAAGGAAAGAFAAPAGMRKLLMDHYEKGDVQDFGDFWERASGATIESIKGGITGLAVAMTGGLAAEANLASPLAQQVLATSAEIAAMTTVGKAIEGHMPQPVDFLEAAVMVAGLHVVGESTAGLATKMRKIYAETGLKPSDVAIEAQNNPSVRQDLLSTNNDIPSVYKDKVEKGPAFSVEGGVPKEAPATNLSDSENKILSQIGEKASAPKQKLSFDNLYTSFIDRLYPIKKAVDELAKDPNNLSADKNAYTLARVQDPNSKVIHVLERGTLDYETLAVNGKSFKEIVEPFKKDTSGFKAYLISKRAIEIEGRGLTSGMDLEAAKDVVKTGKSKYDSAAKDFTDFQNRNLKYLKDSGRIAPELYDKLVEANKDYIPFSRILEPEEGGSSGQAKGKALKKLEGSEKKIQDPFQSVVENTQTLFKMAEENRASSALVNLAKDNPEQTLIKAVTKPKSTLGPNEFEVYENGERKVYKTEAGLAEAVKSLRGASGAPSLLFKIASKLTAIKKVGISFTPDFIVKNIFRDQITAGTFSKSGTNPFTDIVGAIGSVIKKDDNYYNWLKSGGANSSFIELNQRYLEDNVFKLDKETTFLQNVVNTVKKPIEFLEAAGQIGEQATRLAEFSKVSKKVSEGPKVFEGGLASREVTVDFQRMGAKVAAFNSITAFMNVGVQGLDRTIRAIKEDPKGTAAKAAAFITVPSILLWWANKDDERYKQLPQWQKDNFWIIPTDNWKEATGDEAASMPEYLKRVNNGRVEVNHGAIYRLPKPQELGLLFGALPERVLTAFFTDNPHAFAEFEKTIGSLLTPNLTPDILAAPIEQFSNRSMFTGNPIIPHNLEGLLPEYQYTDYTTDSAKQLGKLVAAFPGMKQNAFASPVILENYVRSWSGTLGMYALQLGDKLLTTAGVTPEANKPASTLADIPFIKSFVVRYPSANAQPIVDFHDKYAENKKYIDTIHALAKNGDFENTQKEQRIAEQNGNLINLSGIQTALSNQANFVRMITRNPDIKPQEKRQMIDSIYYQMIATAQYGNKMFEDFKKNVEGK